MADPGFCPGGTPTPKKIFYFFAENCMKMKQFGPPGGRIPGTTPLDPPMMILKITNPIEFFPNYQQHNVGISGNLFFPFLSLV